MKVDLLAAAVRDLDDIFDYGVREHGGELAERYVRSLHAAIDRLGVFPELGAARTLRPRLRLLSVRQHLIFYRIGDASVEVVRVLHQSMDEARHI